MRNWTQYPYLVLSNTQYGFLTGVVWVLSFGFMALARFFVGIGEAALVPAAVSLLAEVFPPARRAAATSA